MLQWLEARQGVTEIYNLLTLQMGNDVMVAVKSRMNITSSADELVNAINRCEAEFRDAFRRCNGCSSNPIVMIREKD